MEKDIETLKIYITAQRNNGVSGNAIHEALTSAGWHHELVTKAFSTDAVTETVPVPEVPQYKPSTQPSVSDKNYKKIKIIGIAMIVLGIWSAIPGQNRMTTVDGIVFGFAIIQILIGVGILYYNKVAYTLFNIFSILMIISSLFYLPLLPLMFLYVTVASSVFGIVIGITGVLLSIVQPAFFIYGGIVFHKKEVRALFSGKRK